MTNKKDAEAFQLQMDLAAFASEFKFAGKGPLCVALVVNEHAQKKGLPLNADDLLAEQGGQVLGLGKAAVQNILAKHGIARVLASEGGRTSRGSIKNMRAYVTFLNSQAANGVVDLAATEQFWINRVNDFFSAKPFELKLDPSWGVRTSVKHLTEQAILRQKQSSGTMFLGTMMQHLVGAKLEVVLGEKNSVSHHGANQSDQDLNRHGDFDLEDVVIHVTSSPGEALIQKCSENLGKGRQPLIITTARGVATAEGLLENAGIEHRVDLIEFEQFIATNVFEMSRFKQAERKVIFSKIIEAYNEIIDSCETDPSLRIILAGGK